MIDAASRRRRVCAAVLAAAMAMSATPVLGFTGTAGAADDPPPVAEPIGDGNVCEDVPGEEPFADVEPTDSSYDEIVCLFQSDLTEGKATTPPTYDPAGTLTRRQMALFLKRLADTADANDLGENVAALPEYDGEEDYSDIGDEADVFKEAIGQLSQVQIALGFEDGTYRPEATLRRRHMAKFIARTLEHLTGEELAAEGDYFDDDQGDTGESEFNQLAELGIFLGDGEGSVDPSGVLTRRQMANILTRTLEVLYEAGDIDRLFPEDPEGVRIAEARALADETAPSVADVGDVHRFIFTEPISPTADDDDSAYRVEDGDGTVADIVCGGSGAECSLNASAVTIGGDEFAANTILTVTLTGPPAIVEPGIPLLQYPLTIVSVTGHWDTDGDPLLLAGSDVEIETGTMSGPTPPTAEQADHEAGSTPTAVSIDFSEDVTFEGAPDDFTVVADGGACGDAAVTNGTGLLVTDDDGDDVLNVAFPGNIAVGSYELCVGAGAVADLEGTANVDHTVALTISEP